jgi:hypothetical protein
VAAVGCKPILKLLHHARGCSYIDSAVVYLRFHPLPMPLPPPYLVRCLHCHARLVLLRQRAAAGRPGDGHCHHLPPPRRHWGGQLNQQHQIARFFIFLSDALLYWYSLSKSCDNEFHLTTQFGMDKDNFDALLIAGNLAKYKGGVTLHSEGSVEIIFRGA